MEILSIRYLTNILKSTKDHAPNFILLTGAGTSVTSGIKSARKLIEEWRRKYFEIYNTEDVNIDDYLKKQHWYEKQNEYSYLFENLFDQPSQRREFIESIIVNAKPSWGYIYLVNLLKKNIFNTIFTTNFDDLINEACFIFSNDVRPIVCAHDSSIRSIRITSKRHKIIKLHGDFLFDNIKNTSRELETLEQNTRDKFKQYASEFGLIVVGYSGNDRSVMDTLNLLLPHEEFFPHGIYWCIRNGDNPSDDVINLQRFPKVKLISIDGFDEMFADIHEELGFCLQDEVSEPYENLAYRLNSLMNNINIPMGQSIHKVIERDIKMLGENINKYSNSKSNNITNLEVLSPAQKKILELDIPLPYGLLSQIYFREKKYDEALKLANIELEKSIDINIFERIFQCLFKLNKEDKIPYYFDQIFKNEKIFGKDPEFSFTLAIILIEWKKFPFADKILDFAMKLYEKYHNEFNLEYYYLNKIQIKKHQSIELNSDDISILRKLIVNDDKFTRLGAYILLDFIREAEEILKKLLDDKENYHILDWPIIKLLIPKIQDKQLEVKINKYLKND